MCPEWEEQKVNFPPPLSLSLSQVTLEAHFFNDLGMDSLDAVEVVMAFEDEFGEWSVLSREGQGYRAWAGACSVYVICVVLCAGCEITDEEAEKVFTCQDAVELLKTKLDIH